jgi:hypothetical protein
MRRDYMLLTDVEYGRALSAINEACDDDLGDFRDGRFDTRDL